MQQPPGYPAPNSSGKACGLVKTLYSLKQSGHCWYQKLVEIMLDKLGFTQCNVNQAVFLQLNSEHDTIVLAHIDNCTIAASSLELIVSFKDAIKEHVKITDLGELHWLLGIKICCDCETRSIHLSQCLYLNSIICCYGFEDLKPVSTPMETHTQLSSSQSPFTTAKFAQMHNVPYHKAVGSAMYASLGTWPDILFAIQTISCFSTKPVLHTGKPSRGFFVT
jgi:hypothetical protein